MADVTAQPSSPRQTHPRRRSSGRRTLRGVILVAVAICVGLTPAVQAHATPSPEEIEAQLDKQWEQLEPVIEQYNKVHNGLVKNRKKAAELERKIKPLAQQVDGALDRIGGLAAKNYKLGPAAEAAALVSGDDRATLTERLTMLNYLAGQEHEQIADVFAVKSKYDEEKAKLDTLIRQQARQDAELAGKKKKIDSEIKRLERLRETAGGTFTIDVGECPPVTVTGKAAIAVRTACEQLGDPYVWGAVGPNSFDCSGLTQYAWKAAGIHLTHFTGDQWKETRSVSRAEARAGDLVFFFEDLHHVGIYLGNGKLVHASRAGQPVKVASIEYMPLAGFRRVA
ncbi:NlpC/P60 family protein [Plantactinospora sp. KLBMP9567]|uniref:C40 family peptidase n=1 Tax=Plantactinospora sp. KLBMP9567 TaxID=3085900 RepID=UPI003990B175